MKLTSDYMFTITSLYTKMLGLPTSTGEPKFDSYTDYLPRSDLMLKQEGPEGPGSLT